MIQRLHDWLRPECEVGRRDPTELERCEFEERIDHISFITPENGQVRFLTHRDGYSLWCDNTLIRAEQYDRSKPVYARRWRWDRV